MQALQLGFKLAQTSFKFGPRYRFPLRLFRCRTRQRFRLGPRGRFPSRSRFRFGPHCRFAPGLFFRLCDRVFRIGT